MANDRDSQSLNLWGISSSHIKWTF